MKQSFFEFNPKRDDVLKLIGRLRETYPDEFPAAWAAAAKSWKNLGADLDPTSLDSTCVSCRVWLKMAGYMAPKLFHMGPMRKGMRMVDMDRLGEPEPTLADLVLSDEDRAWLAEDDEDEGP